MNKFTSVLIALVIGAGLFFAKRHFTKKTIVELPKYGNYLSCHGHPFDLRVKYQTEAYLLTEALPKEEQSQNYLHFQVAYYQQMFAFTNAHDYNQNSKLKWSSLSDAEPKIKILKVDDATYPYDAEIPSDIDIVAFPPDATVYLNNLKALGKTTKGAPAKRITYEFENDLFMCFNEKKVDLEGLKVVHPLDPYTAYFIIPVAERKLITNDVRKTSHTVNPCMNPVSMPPNGQNPFFLWYSWRPFAEGHDSNHTAFNCNQYYKENESIKRLELSLSENVPKDIQQLNFAKFRDLDRPLEVAIFLGAQESLTYKKLNKEDAERYVKRFLSGIDALTAKKELPVHENKYDPKFSTTLWLMRNIAEQMDLKNASMNIQEYHAQINIKGKLKLSKRDLNLKLFFSQTNPKYPGAEEFGQSFADEFLKSDVVIYEGHVNSGNVFADTLAKNKEVMLKNQNKNINYQIFALYSCTANFYFRPESFPTIDHPEFRRDFIRTGGDFSDGVANSSLALIGQLDSFLYNQNSVAFAFWSRNAKSDNFYILSNH